MSNSRSRIAVSVVVCILAIVGGCLLYARHGQPPARVFYNGRLRSVDLSAMAVDGPGVYVVDARGGRITVHLDPGESACDPAAIAAPRVKVGDTIQVRGDRGSDGIVRVCAAGTFIKSAS